MGIFISYGVIMGIGLGTGYLSPVKTLMLWFSEQKGLATGLAQQYTVPMLQWSSSAGMAARIHLF